MNKILKKNAWILKMCVSFLDKTTLTHSTIPCLNFEQDITGSKTVRHCMGQFSVPPVFSPTGSGCRRWTDSPGGTTLTVGDPNGDPNGTMSQRLIVH